ncbi:hypothetical protein HY413_00995 [Candidatus Kaiserbacteria bacterium]|nr:hypothetical protein [Candidatus Kaiserbacteria bacterium]
MKMSVLALVAMLAVVTAGMSTDALARYKFCDNEPCQSVLASATAQTEQKLDLLKGSMD